MRVNIKDCFICDSKNCNNLVFPSDIHIKFNIEEDKYNFCKICSDKLLRITRKKSIYKQLFIDEWS